MADIGPENYSSYAEGGLPLAYLFVGNEEQRQEFGPLVEVVAKDFKGRVNFVYIDGNKYGGHAGNLNLKQEWPAFAIQRPQQNLKFPFDQSKVLLLLLNKKNETKTKHKQASNNNTINKIK